MNKKYRAVRDGVKRHVHVDELRARYAEHRTAIVQRLASFKAVPAEKYFYELCYCLMTPQSSALNAAQAQTMLQLCNFQYADVEPEPLLHQKEYYIRFHKTKSQRLKEMKDNYTAIHILLCSEQSAIEKRQWLVENVKGFGYKEASHVLRNIGMNDGMAIIDRHILKNLKKHNVIHELPTSMSAKKYFSIEKKFQQFAAAIGISIDELDLLFWSNETGEILK